MKILQICLRSFVTFNPSFHRYSQGLYSCESIFLESQNQHYRLKVGLNYVFSPTITFYSVYWSEKSLIIKTMNKEVACIIAYKKFQIGVLFPDFFFQKEFIRTSTFISIVDNYNTSDSHNENNDANVKNVDVPSKHNYCQAEISIERSAS